jgi:hypothetical protein
MQGLRRQFYNIELDEAARDVWYLASPTDHRGDEIDPRCFTQGAFYEGPPPVNVSIRYDGARAAFNLASFAMPVVSSLLADEVERLATSDIQRFPITVDSTITGFEILNVARTIKCVDEKRSYIMRWTEADERPDKVGQYRMVGNLTIDPSMPAGANIFRVKGWEVALLVSDDMKGALERVGTKGIAFRRAS